MRDVTCVTKRKLTFIVYQVANLLNQLLRPKRDIIVEARVQEGRIGFGLRILGREPRLILLVHVH